MKSFLLALEGSVAPWWFHSSTSGAKPGSRYPQDLSDLKLWLKQQSARVPSDACPSFFTPAGRGGR